MKTMLIILMLIASPVFAMNKCVIDGKTVYQQAQCPEGTAKEIKGAFSATDTSGVRKHIYEDEQAQLIKQQEAQIKALEQAQKMKDAQLQDQLDRIERKSNQAAREAAQIRNQQTFDKIMRGYR